MMFASIYGRLTQDVKAIDTQSGKSMSVTSVAVNLQIPKSEDTHTQFFNVVAFGRVADDLQRCKKGEPIGLSGRVQASKFTDRNGDEKTQLSLVADSIVSARTVRPGGRKKQTEAQAPAEAFSDQIPF